MNHSSYLAAFLLAFAFDAQPLFAKKLVTVQHQGDASFLPPCKALTMLPGMGIPFIFLVGFLKLPNFAKFHLRTYSASIPHV